MSSCQFIFTGDLSITGIFQQKIIENKEIFDVTIKNILKKNDILVCNLEGPVTQKPNLLRKDIRVVSPIGGIKYLTERNFNIFNLGNNHIFDCGLEGFLDTIELINSHNAKYFGAGTNIEDASKPLYVKKDNLKFALISVSHLEGLIASKKAPGVFYFKKYSLLKKRISEARHNADWVILNFHGGEEYTTIPMPLRRKILHKLTKLDIDLIICHHSHVFQGYETINNTLIFYSLGNLIFDIDALKNKEFTYEGALLKIYFNKKEYNFEFIPIQIDIDQGIIIEGKEEFLEHIKNISNFTNYRSIWLKDAYRTFFQSNLKVKKVNIKSNEFDYDFVNTSNKKIKSLFLHKYFYFEIFKIIKNPNRRPIFFGAIQYLLLEKINKIC